MNDTISRWLIDNLPPDVGPVLAGWAAHFEAFRAFALILSIVVLSLVALLFRAIYRWMTS